MQKVLLIGRRLVFAVLLLLITGSPNVIIGQQGLGPAEGRNWGEGIIPAIPPAPSTAAMMRFADVPVSYSTGIPNINIPLYSIRSGSLSLPISLDYHAGGIKVDGKAANTGAGWTLNAGGAISRSVRGDADPLACSYLQNDTVRTNLDYGGWPEWVTVTDHDCERYNHFLSKWEEGNCEDYDPDDPNWRVVYHYSGGGPLDSVNLISNYLRVISTGPGTKMPDMFSYNFAGRVGKYFLDKDRNALKVPSNDLYIHLHCFESGGKPYWTVIDEGGTQYVFGSKASSRELIEFHSGGLTALDALSSWHLDYIISADLKDTIKFHYENYTLGSFESSESTTWKYWLKSESEEECGEPFGVSLEINTSYQFVTNGVRLAAIEFQEGWVEFEWNHERQDLSGDSALTYFAVYQGQYLDRSDTLVAYDFHYSYQSSKLRLDSLVHKSGYSYALDYYPGTFNERKDLWGFNYGASATSNIPKHENIIHIADVVCINTSGVPLNFYAEPTPLYPINYGEDMEAQFGATVIGTLRSIRYPTGGVDSFYYELNKTALDISDTSNQDWGGLRIAKITRNPVVGERSMRVFEYAEGYPSIFPKYTKCHENTDACMFLLISSDHLSTDQFGQPPSLYYTWVQEAYIKGADSVITEHFYSASSYAQFSESPIPNTVNYDGYYYYSTPYYDTPGLSGRELKTVVYESTPAGRRKQSESITTYANIKPSYRNYEYGISVGHELRYHEDFSSQPSNRFCWGHVKLESNVYLPIRKWQHQTEYDEAGNAQTISSLTSISYVSDRTLTQSTESYRSNGDTLITEYRYPDHYADTSSIAGTDDIARAVQQMQQRHMIGVPIEEVHYIKPADGSGQRVLWAKLLEFKVGQPTASDSFPRVTAVHSYLPAAPSTGHITSLIDGTGAFYKDADYQEELRITGYDDAGNIVMAENRKGIPSAFIWGYEDQHLIAVAQNATDSTVAYSSFEHGESNGWIMSGGAIDTLDGRTGKASFQFTGGTLSWPIPAGSYVVSFWAKGTGTLNVGSQAVNLTSDWQFFQLRHNQGAGGNLIVSASSSTSKIDELRAHPVEAQMQSLTYDLLTGVTSMIGPNGIPVFYEYDDQQRLQTVRDQAGQILKFIQYRLYNE